MIQSRFSYHCSIFNSRWRVWVRSYPSSILSIYHPHLTLASAIPHFLLPPLLPFSSSSSNKEISHGFYIKIKFVHAFFYIPHDPQETWSHRCVCVQHLGTQNQNQNQKKMLGDECMYMFFFLFLKSIYRQRERREAYTCISLERIIITGWGVFISIHILTV